ncbi:MAG: hypothetical protein ACRCZD_04015 [Phycicoccus sp.]
MSSRHDDDPVEHDPTGIRELLSRLPEPGPMPPDLVARISAALADESGGIARLRPDSTTASSNLGTTTPRSDRTGPDDDSTAVLVPSRRPRWQVLGAAAAVLAVIGLGGLVVSTMPGGIEASMGMSEDSAGSTGRGGQLVPPSEAGERADAGVADVQVVTTGTAYSTVDLADQARVVAGLSAERPAARPVPGSVEGGASGAVATPDGALTCAQALGPETWVTVVVDIATVDGRPAAVLVLTDGTGRTVAYAVARSCTTGAPAVVRGPLPLG